MVTAPEAAALLATAASFDNRTASAETSRAWAEAIADLDFQDARQAIIDHYAQDHRWIMPSDVRAGVSRIERTRLSEAPRLELLDPPAEIEALEGDEFDAAYLAWRQENARRARKGLPLIVGHTRRELVS